MAPAPGHLLAPAARRLVKYAISKANALLRAQLPTTANTSSSSSTKPVLEAIPVHTKGNGTQPTHPLAFLKQVRSQSGYGERRFFSTGANHPKLLRNTTDLPKARRTFQTSTRVGAAISKSANPRPFASILRPNLTGGALPRRAGGYTLGGAKKFSSTASVQANVVQNVSQAIRAMVLKGERARYDGIDPVTGHPIYRRVHAVENQVSAQVRKSAMFAQQQQQQQQQQKGTTLRFKLAPTVTAISATYATGLGDVAKPLERDLARGVQELIAVNREVKKLADGLGDLPMTLEYRPTGPSLEVRFPGCDGQTVENLCDELGICRGVVVEDPGWSEDKDAEMALLFPFAPVGESRPPSPPRHQHNEKKRPLLPRPRKESSVISEDGFLPTPSGTTTFLFENDEPYHSLSHSLSPSDIDLDDLSDDDDGDTVPAGSSQGSFDGIEGIYRFLRECDDLRR